jgi:hypothetical protein
MLPFLLQAATAIVIVVISRSSLYDWSKDQLLGTQKLQPIPENREWEGIFSLRKRCQQTPSLLPPPSFLLQLQLQLQLQPQSRTPPSVSKPGG